VENDSHHEKYAIVPSLSYRIEWHRTDMGYSQHWYGTALGKAVLNRKTPSGESECDAKRYQVGIQAR
jgi:hypothetical protein